MRYIISETVTYQYEVYADSMDEALEKAADFTDADRMNQEPSDACYSYIVETETGKDRIL